MSDEKEENKHRPGYQWLGRSLQNYKQMHSSTASDKGCSKEFQACKTLTAARKVLWGFKKKNTR